MFGTGTVWLTSTVTMTGAAADAEAARLRAAATEMSRAILFNGGSFRVDG
jgi:hypothetical protein